MAQFHTVDANLFFFFLLWPEGICSAGNSSAPWRDPAWLILSILREIKSQNSASKRQTERPNSELWKAELSVRLRSVLLCPQNERVTQLQFLREEWVAGC